MYPPNPPSPPSPFPQRGDVHSAAPVWSASSLPQSIVTHPVCSDPRANNPFYLQATTVFIVSIKKGRVSYSGFEGSLASGRFAWARHYVMSPLFFSSSCLKCISDCSPCHSPSMSSARPATWPFYSRRFPFGFIDLFIICFFFFQTVKMHPFL